MEASEAKGKKGGAAKAAPLFPAGKYKCPKCSNRVTVFVNMSMPPACSKHSNGPVAMTKEG
jgi:hypothetical protein